MKCDSCFHKKVCRHYSNYKTETYAYMGISFKPDECKDYVDVSEYIKKEKILNIIDSLEYRGFVIRYGSEIAGWNDALEKVKKNIQKEVHKFEY